MLEIDIAHGIIFQKLSLKNETRKDNTIMRYQHNFNKVQINYAFNILLKEDFITE